MFEHKVQNVIFSNDFFQLNYVGVRQFLQGLKLGFYFVLLFFSLSIFLYVSYFYLLLLRPFRANAHKQWTTARYPRTEKQQQHIAVCLMA